jgi:branched-chain amino acid transport system substrate-binding protein
MKKFLALAMALAMTFSLAACGGDTGGSASGGAGGSASGGSNPVLKVGVFEPASGDNGAGGKQEVLGVQYANQVVPTVEIGGQTYDVKLEIVDNQSTTDKAITAAQTLVNAGVSVVLGSYGSGVSIAAAPTFEQAKIPAIGISCTNPAVTELNPYYFRVCFLDPFQGSVMANFVSEEFGAKKAYVLTMLGEDYGSGLGTYFKQAFEGLGGEVKAESFPEGTSDFSAYIQNAVTYGADVIFAPSSTTYAALIVGQAAKAGITIPITAGDTWENSAILAAQKGTDQKVYCSTFFDENDDAGPAAAFVKGFKEFLNADAQNLTNNGGNDIVAAVSALGYDAYMTAIEAVKLAQSAEGEAIQAALFDVDIDAVTGRITINPETGDANKTEAYIKQATDGAFTFVKRQSVEG